MGNFFLPNDPASHAEAEQVIEQALRAQGFTILLSRDVPVNNDAIRPAAIISAADPAVGVSLRF